MRAAEFGLPPWERKAETELERLSVTTLLIRRRADQAAAEADDGIEVATFAGLIAVLGYAVAAGLSSLS